MQIRSSTIAISALQTLFYNFSGCHLPQDLAVKWLSANGDESEIEIIARTCHEANRGYCQILGDHSQMPWAQSPEWQRKSAIAGVRFIQANPDASPAASHDSWMAEKKADGWKYGPVKDPEKKEHPCYVPYEQLPVEQRAKDYIFGAIARALLAEVNA